MILGIIRVPLEALNGCLRALGRGRRIVAVDFREEVPSQAPVIQGRGGIGEPLRQIARDSLYAVPSMGEFGHASFPPKVGVEIADRSRFHEIQLRGPLSRVRG
jgi:hypothetical protein